MKINLSKLLLASFLLLGARAYSATTIGWASAGGNFLSSSAVALTSGGVSIGYFTGAAPADAAFGTTINGWADLLAAGYKDVRTLSGVSLGGLDWDYPLSGGGGSVTAVPFSTTTTDGNAIAALTQLYVVAFNAGAFNSGTPASSFSGATEWAVVKDNANTAPADLGTRNVVLLNAVGASEILRGTDNGNNVNLTALAAIPEPSKGMLSMLSVFLLCFRRRR